MQNQRMDKAATERALLALATDIVAFQQMAERVTIQVRALAERHGIELPCPVPLQG